MKKFEQIDAREWVAGFALLAMKLGLIDADSLSTVLAEGSAPEDSSRDAEPPGVSEDVCLVSNSYYRPAPETQEKPAAWFLGKLVKVRFDFDDLPVGEYLWAEVVGRSNDRFAALLRSHPWSEKLKCGDLVAFRKDEIVAVSEDEPRP